MKSLEWIVESNRRAVETCTTCHRTRNAIESRGGFLHEYETLSPDPRLDGFLGLFCRDCTSEANEREVVLKRVCARPEDWVPQPWDGRDVGEDAGEKYRNRR